MIKLIISLTVGVIAFVIIMALVAIKNCAEVMRYEEKGLHG